MAFSSGTYSLYTPGNPVVTGTTIASSWANNTLNDVATGLSTCILKDGTQTLTGNIPFGNFRITGLGAATGANDAVRASQLQLDNICWVAAGGVADAITATYVPANASLVDGMLLGFRATAANATTTPTFAPDGLTARTITKVGGTALAAGDIKGNLTEVLVRYNLANTRWELLNPLTNFGTQTANLVYAGPGSGGAATPTFRALVAADIAAGVLTIHPMELRLSLTTATPVTTADVTAATTIFLTPYRGGNIDLFNTPTWTTINTAEVSVVVPATTSTPFDIFARNVGGVVTLDTTNWTNDTTRATALVYQNGVLVKSGDTTRRYLGTGRTTAVSGQTEDSVKNRYLVNYYNRTLRNGLNTFTADRTTASNIYVELNSEIRINFVIGISEDAVFSAINGSNSSNISSFCGTAITFDSTSAAEPGFECITFASATNPEILAISGAKIGLSIGGHFATTLGRMNANTGTWYSSSTTSQAKCYLHFGIMG